MIALLFGHVGVGIQGLEAWSKRYWLKYLVWKAPSISPSVFAERTTVPFRKRAIECAARLNGHFSPHIVVLGEQWHTVIFLVGVSLYQICGLQRIALSSIDAFRIHDQV